MTAALAIVAVVWLLRLAWSWLVPLLPVLAVVAAAALVVWLVIRRQRRW
ncbi:MAG TPA: hypothetical protein VHB02_05480 [Acidimicrobiales bacterium]|nr:hypothetical protein [Acidimicrobiales bacterium]